MKRTLFTFLHIGVALLFISSALAVGQGLGENPNAPGQAIASEALSKGAQQKNEHVPQAQIDTVKKREEMKQRRDELLKLRQQLIDADDPGNVDGQQPIPIQ